MVLEGSSAQLSQAGLGGGSLLCSVGRTAAIAQPQHQLHSSHCNGTVGSCCMHLMWTLTFCTTHRSASSKKSFSSLFPSVCACSCTGVFPHMPAEVPVMHTSDRNCYLRSSKRAAFAAGGKAAHSKMLRRFDVGKCTSRYLLYLGALSRETKEVVHGGFQTEL